jgi:hypothetical protein
VSNRARALHYSALAAERRARRRARMTERLTTVREALQDVEARLRDGRITDEQFGMSLWDEGTCACVGGWVERLHPHLCLMKEPDKRLLNLLFPVGASGVYGATPVQAADAVARYLDGHEPWPYGWKMPYQRIST